MTVGVNHDTLLTVGWFDLLPRGRSSSTCRTSQAAITAFSSLIRLTSTFAYVGTRATGTQAKAITSSGVPDWKGQARERHEADIFAKQCGCSSSTRRVLVYSDFTDLPAAYNLAKRIQVMPLTIRPPSH